LPGYGGANNNDAAVVTYLTGRNTLSTAAASNTVPTGGGWVGGAACTQPSFALLTPKTTNERNVFARVSKPARSSESSKSGTANSDVVKREAASQTFSHHAT